MASQALYRKWRSQTFGDLVGQEHVVQTLRNAIRTNRVGHAYLFTGPRGVGKTTVARLLAKAVNCEASVEERPCDRCEACRSIAEGRAVDVIEMDAASHTGVDDAREIIERVQFRPTSLRTKVYVIDETHMLSTAAFNALLKTLEEPPAHVLFILATTEFHKLPATIVSRCQRFVFTRHSIRDIADRLLHVAAAEHITLDPTAAEVIARSATGAMRDALSVLDQLIAGSDETVTLAQTQSLLGAAESGEVMTLVRALADSDLQAALRLINQVADDGVDLRQFARDLVERLRALMLLIATGDRATLDLPGDTLDEMEGLSTRLSLDLIMAWLKLFANLDYQLKNSPYGQLPLELAVVELLVVPAPGPVVAQVAVTPPRPRSQAETTRSRPTPPVPPRSESVPQPSVSAPVSAQPVPPPSNEREPEEQPEAPAPEKPVVMDRSAGVEVPQVIEVEDNAAFPLADVEAIWKQFVEDVRAENRLTFAQLEGAVPINIEEQTVVLLATKGKWQKGRLENEKTRRLLERMLSKTLNIQAHIRVTVDEQEEMPDTRKRIQNARNDPMVRKAINIFEAEVIGIDTP